MVFIWTLTWTSLAIDVHVKLVDRLYFQYQFSLLKQYLSICIIKMLVEAIAIKRSRYSCTKYSVQEDKRSLQMPHSRNSTNELSEPPLRTSHLRRLQFISITTPSPILHRMFGNTVHTCIRYCISGQKTDPLGSHGYLVQRHLLFSRPKETSFHHFRLIGISHTKIFMRSCRSDLTTPH